MSRSISHRCANFINPFSFLFSLIWSFFFRPLVGSRDFPKEVRECGSFTGHQRLVDRALMSISKVRCCNCHVKRFFLSFWTLSKLQSSKPWSHTVLFLFKRERPFLQHTARSQTTLYTSWRWNGKPCMQSQKGSGRGY